jgi:hypothetical protein
MGTVTGEVRPLEGDRGRNAAIRAENARMSVRNGPDRPHREMRHRAHLGSASRSELFSVSLTRRYAFLVHFSHPMRASVLAWLQQAF